MKIQDVKKQERKGKTITVRTYPSYCKWMKDNEVSPTKAFNQAIKELMDEKKK